jgi:DNA invertase Pin-like site-specific DNA recombinase
MSSKDTDSILKEILKWQELQGKRSLREMIPSLIDNDTKRVVYEMTDGNNSVSDIASKVGISVGTVSNLWNLWYSYGILLKRKNRYIKIISLKELGIE